VTESKKDKEKMPPFLLGKENDITKQSHQKRLLATFFDVRPLYKRRMALTQSSASIFLSIYGPCECLSV
jgi:hypothetical protein